MKNIAQEELAKIDLQVLYVFQPCDEITEKIVGYKSLTPKQYIYILIKKFNNIVIKIKVNFQHTLTNGIWENNEKFYLIKN